MALGSVSVSVGTSPTKLGNIDTGATVQAGAADIFLGGATVTATTGVKVATTTTLTVFGHGQLYAVTSAGTSTTLALLS
jgi:hypothetical protein